MIRESMIALLALSSAAFAQQECAAIQSPEDRLNCYDEAFKITTTPEAPGNWNVEIEKSKLDDTTTVMMMVLSEEALPGRFGGSEKGALMVRCKESTTSVYTIWGGHFMSDHQGGGRVDYRIDTAPAKNVAMDVSTDNKALGLWQGGASIPFVKAMFGASSIYMRATPFSESSQEMTFNIKGIEEAITPLREACGW